MTRAVSIVTNADVTEIFATPIVQYVWPNSVELNQKLRTMILEKEEEGGSVKSSNEGGWHSERDLLSWNDTSIQTLEGLIHSILSTTMIRVLKLEGKNYELSWRISAWANVSRFGARNLLHNHGNNIWSGVYYVSAKGSEASENGNLILHDPRPIWNPSRAPNELVIGPTYRILPEPGLMVVFPGYLYHLVEPYWGSTERISIAFNAQIEYFDIVS